MYISYSGAVRKADDINNDVKVTSLLKYRQILPPLSTVVTEQTISLVSKLDNRRYVGWRIPHFHRRVRSQKLMPHTDWTRVEIQGSASGSYNAVVLSGSVQRHYWSEGLWFSDVNDWLMSEDTLTAVANSLDIANIGPYLIQKAAAKMYGRGYDALTALVELRELPQLFVGTARRLVDCVKVVKRFCKRKKLDWRAVSLSTASDWLQSRYGWRTTLYDIDEISQMIANYNLKQAEVLADCSREQHSSTSTSTYDHPKTRWVLHNTVSDSVMLKLVGSVNALINVPKLQFNPLTTAWEATKLSFVVDWVVGVGDALQAASFLMHQNKYTASYGYRVEINRIVTSSITPNEKLISGGQAQSATVRGVYDRRHPSTVSLIPRYKLKLNAYKVADLVALMRQALRRK